MFNKYQGLSTNPIINVDTTGHFSLEDLLIDIGTAVVFAIAAIATGGAALAALPALVAAEGAVAVSTVVATVALAVTAVASATGAVASAVKAADDVDDAVTGKHFLTNDQRSALGTVQMVAGAVAGVSGLAAVGATAAGAIAEGAAVGAEDATQDAADFLADADDETDVVNRRNAVVEGEDSDNANLLQPGETIGPDPELSNMDDDAVSVSYSANNARSSADSILDGPSSRAAEPRPVTPSASRPIPIQQNVLREVLGTGDMNATDEAVINTDRGLTASLNANESADEAVSGSFGADAARSTGTSPVLTAMNGNWSEEAYLLGRPSSFYPNIRTPSMMRFDVYRITFSS